MLFWRYLGVFAADLHLHPRSIDDLTVWEFYHLVNVIDRTREEAKRG